MMAQLKVAIVSESFGYTSGVGVVIRMLVKFFLAMGAKVLLIGPAHLPSTREDWKGCETLWLESKVIGNRGYRRTAIVSPKNNSLILEALRGVNLVFCESVSTLVLRVMILHSKKFLEGRVVFHAHTMADRYLWAWYGPLLGALLNLAIVKPITQFCLKVADARLAPSQFFADYLARTQQCKKSILPWPAPVEIPLDLPDPKETEVGRLVLQFKKEHKVVFIANGRVCEEKRSGQLIRLVLRMRRLGCDVGLVFVGGGDLNSYRNGIFPCDRKHFLFTGVLVRDLGIAINALCDIGIALAVTDTQSLSFLEQMAMGLAMIAPDNTVMGGYVQACNCGKAISKRTIAGMASELKAFVRRSEDFDEYGRRAQSHVANNFSEAGQIEELKHLVEGLLTK